MVMVPGAPAPPQAPSRTSHPTTAAAAAWKRRPRWRRPTPRRGPPLRTATATAVGAPPPLPCPQLATCTFPSLLQRLFRNLATQVCHQVFITRRITHSLSVGSQLILQD